MCRARRRRRGWRHTALGYRSHTGINGRQAAHWPVLDHFELLFLEFVEFAPPLRHPTLALSFRQHSSEAAFALPLALALVSSDRVEGTGLKRGRFRWNAQASPCDPANLRRADRRQRTLWSSHVKARSAKMYLVACHVCLLPCPMLDLHSLVAAAGAWRWPLFHRVRVSSELYGGAVGAPLSSCLSCRWVRWMNCSPLSSLVCV